MKLGKIGITFVCGALTICMGLVGCGTKGEGASPSGAPSAKDMQGEDQTTQVVRDARQVFGTQTSGSHEVALSNGLEGTITSVRLRSAGAKTFEESLLGDAGRIAVGEEVRLFVTPNEGDAAFDLAVELEGSNEVTQIDGVPLTTYANVRLARKDAVVYLEYVTTDGERGTTYAGNDASESTEAQHPNATQQVQSQDSQTQQVQEMGYDAGRGVAYEEPDGYGYDAAAPVEVAPVDEAQGTEYPTNEAPAEVPVEVPVAAPSDVSQTSDACMGDVVLRD